MQLLFLLTLLLLELQYTTAVITMTTVPQSRLKDATLTKYFESTSLQSNPAIVVGFGSLMSERSAKSTFPSLSNFKPVRVEGYRRVFSHPTAIFFERGIACLESKQMASLSIEKAPGHAFSGTAFNLSDMEDPMALLAREEGKFLFTKHYFNLFPPIQI